MDAVSRRDALAASATVALLAGTAGALAQGASSATPGATDPNALRALIEAARSAAPGLAELMTRYLPGLQAGGAAAVPARTAVPMGGTTTVGTLASGNVAAVWGQDFLFALASEEPATIAIDGRAPVPMTRVAGTAYWYRLETLRIGATHTFTLFSGGRDVGTNSVAGYTPDSYPVPGATRGTLSEKRSITSRIYGGATADYWIYANAGIDTVRGAPLMVWQDGQNCIGVRDLINFRLQTVTDNLVHQNRIPPMVHLLIAPGTGGETRPLRFPGESQDNVMRSLQYDTVSDRYGRYLHDEVLPEVEKTVKLRQDAYSRGVAGQSSGGICSFTLGWFQPNRFSRVHSTIGSFTGLQWLPEEHLEGGYILSNLVRREAKRNIRVWMSDGLNDIEVDSNGRQDLYVAGSWPLNNIQMANALKTRGYDFHFRYGVATHSSAQGAMDLPESLSWLWRGYDPEKTTETFEQEEVERAKPIFRVQIANRDAW
jgi:enterochelin esterase-like enzyme